MSIFFHREYHNQWFDEIAWLMSDGDVIESPPANLVLARSIISAAKNSMPSGIESYQLQRFTSCDSEDINALVIACVTTPDLQMKLELLGGRVFVA